jgi:protocatechuate 3,4-dioxygenase beta subunit
VRTDELGNFEVRDIAPQEGVAAVRVSGKAPGHARATVPVRVPVASSQRVFVELRLPVGGAIAGRVTDSRGTPLEGVQACVAFVMTSDHGEMAQGGLSATTGAKGDYLLDSVPEGRYVVEVGYGAGLARSGGEVPDGFEVALDLPSLTPSGAPAESNLSIGARIAKQLATAKGLALRWFPEVVVQAGQTTRLDVELFPPGAVSGRVLDENGAPVVDAHVTLESIERWPSVGLSGSTITSTTGLVITSRGEDGKGETELAEIEGEARTDERGAFEFGGLADGEKRLGVTSTGLVSQSRALDLKPGEVRAGEDFVLDRGLSIRGRLRDEMGAPIEGASVEAAPLGENAFIGGELSTDAEGRFEISGLPPGPRRLLVFKPGFKSLQTHVAPGGDELELTMEPAPKVIGIVTNGVQGGPITNFDVSISYEGSSWTNSGGNYPDGRFEMPIDSDTPCTVTIRSGGFQDVVMKDVLPSRTALDPLQIRLLPE